MRRQKAQGKVFVLIPGLICIWTFTGLDAELILRQWILVPGHQKAVLSCVEVIYSKMKLSESHCQVPLIP